MFSGYGLPLRCTPWGSCASRAAGLTGEAIVVAQQLLYACAAFVVALYFAALDPPAVERKETVNFAELMVSVNTAYVAPGKAKPYYLYGPWLDHAASVTLLGRDQVIVERRRLAESGGGLLRVNLTVPLGTARGLRAATIQIRCGVNVVGGCRTGALSMPVMVLNVGTLNSLAPDAKVASQSAVTFTISGTGLDVAEVFAFRTTLANPAVLPGQGAGTMQVRGLTSACGRGRIYVRDRAEGGDFYPYSPPAGLEFQLATACAPDGQQHGPAPAPCPRGLTYAAPGVCHRSG